MVKRYPLAVNGTVSLLSFCDWQPLLDRDRYHRPTNGSWKKAAKAREPESNTSYIHTLSCRELILNIRSRATVARIRPSPGRDVDLHPNRKLVLSGRPYMHVLHRKSLDVC